MQITFLGVSSYLSDGFSSNVILDGDFGDTLLIDCGDDISLSLKAAGREVDEIDAVYISHLHGDHCGGLEWLGYYSFFMTKKRIQLFIHESLVSDLWNMLRPAMDTLPGQETLTLDDYFDVYALSETIDGRWFCFDQKYFYLKKNMHIKSKTRTMYSYGLFVKDEVRSFFYISTDTSYDHPYKAGLNFDILEKQKNLLFQDCDVMNLSGAHVNYDDLKKLHPDIKNKMWLYHYTDLSKYGGKYGAMPDAVADGFAGFIKQGQQFEWEYE